MQFHQTLILLLLATLPKSSYSFFGTSPNDQIASLEKQAFSSQPGDPSTLQLWDKILSLDPKNCNARIQLGLAGMANPDKRIQEEAFTYLQEAFDKDVVHDTIPMPSFQGILLASVIGRYRWEQDEYSTAQKFLQIAYDNQYHKTRERDLCLSLQLGTMIDPYPRSLEEKNKSILSFQKRLEEFLQKNKNKKHVVLNEEYLRESIPGAANDPYIHCICSLFYLELYYVENIAYLANLHYQTIVKVWPKLSSDYFDMEKNGVYTAPRKQQYGWCRKNKKIKLGIASGLFNINTPVESDFQGVISNLDRNKFDITFILTNERNQPMSPVLNKHDADGILLIQKLPTDNSGDWVTRYHKQILDLELDVLLYLDTTMSSQIHRLAMTRLAPVTAVTHGHPITSGFPQHVMDYYISWHGAELDTAQKYYTEELILLPKDRIHQYYEYNNMDLKNHVSLHDGMSYEDLLTQDRSSLWPVSDHDNHWYLCMQKPFKLQPEFDEIICGILQHDPKARVILHQANSLHNSDNLLYRFQQIPNCDVHRINILPVQPHSRLLALYTKSDVVLDSYPMSGCTTTREVLQLSKVVMTLPSTLLGSRWTYGYYNIMGDDVLNNHVIAKDKNDYIQKAVALGTNIELRNEMERRVAKRVYKLFYSKNAVLQWEKVLTGIAMERCDVEVDDNEHVEEEVDHDYVEEEDIEEENKEEFVPVEL